MDNIVKLSSDDIEAILDLLRGDPWEVLAAYDDIDKAVKFKVNGRWCRPLGELDPRYAVKP